jgi:hypothetical protein
MKDDAQECDAAGTEAPRSDVDDDGAAVKHARKCRAGKTRRPEIQINDTRASTWNLSVFPTYDHPGSYSMAHGTSPSEINDVA